MSENLGRLSPQPERERVVYGLAQGGTRLEKPCRFTLFCFETFRRFSWRERKPGQGVHLWMLGRDTKMSHLDNGMLRAFWPRTSVGHLFLI